MSDKEDKNKSKKNGLVSWFIKTLLLPLGELNKGLRVCYRITGDDYFKSQMNRNKIFRFLSWTPILSAFFILYVSVTKGVDIFKPKFIQIIKNFNIKQIGSISLPEEFYFYCIYTIATVLALWLSTQLMAFFVRKTHPILRKSAKTRKYFVNKGYIKSEDAILVETPRGLLVECDGDINSIIKDDGLWSKIDRRPKDPIREGNGDLYFIGYGFVLKKSYVMEL